MSWCLQCGSEGRPTRATGVDEDGEPACVGHAVKEFGAGLNAAGGRAPAVPAPIKQPAAAPSPVQTKAEDEMEERICSGYNGPCPKQQQLGRLNKTGICTTCYARKKYAEKYSATARGKKPKKATPQRVEILDAPKVGASTHSSGEAQATFGLNHFSLKQLDRVWSLLSPESKAQAVDVLLSYVAL